LEHPIRFAHYEFGLLFSEGTGGIDDDVQQELERRSGCKFLIDVRPRARIWYELEGGTLDMAGSGVETPARDKFAWFASYVVEDNQVHISSKVPVSIKSFEDFIDRTNLTIGGVRSYSYSPYYDRQVEKLTSIGRFTGAVDPTMLYRMFELGRFDIFIASQMLSLHYFKVLKMPVPRIESWDSGTPTPSGLVISKRSFTPQQAAGWRKLIDQMLLDGTVKKILVRHMGKDWAPRGEYQRPKNPGT
jgi:polar amino acid transport system substrate-binding protein